MTEQEVRALVREAVERHLSRPAAGGHAAPAADGIARPGDRPPAHPSHILLQVLPGSEVDEGACVIEPAVRCNHCGFCQSYGH